jgi:hypothetical protein
MHRYHGINKPNAMLIGEQVKGCNQRMKNLLFGVCLFFKDSFPSA